MISNSLSPEATVQTEWPVESCLPGSTRRDGTVPTSGPLGRFASSHVRSFRPERVTSIPLPPNSIPSLTMSMRDRVPAPHSPTTLLRYCRLGSFQPQLVLQRPPAAIPGNYPGVNREGSPGSIGKLEFRGPVCYLPHRFGKRMMERVLYILPPRLSRPSDPPAIPTISRRPVRPRWPPSGAVTVS